MAMFSYYFEADPKLGLSFFAYDHIILLIELQENETLQTTTNFRIQVRSVQVMHSRV